MATNLKKDENGFARLTQEQVSSYQKTVVDLIKATTAEDVQEVTIISGEPIYFKTKGILEKKLELPIWDDDTFNFFLEHIAKQPVANVYRRSTRLEINTNYFDTLVAESDYSKDFAVSVQNRTLRVHAVSMYNAKAENKYKYCFTIRVVMNIIPTYEELNLPKLFEKATTLKSGLFLISGHVSAGKSTTVASLIQAINRNPAMSRSVLTIEDPVEYVHESSQALILQRALGINVNSYEQATKDALRENVEIVVIGELREAEAMDNAIRLAEMGKLVFATVHCNSPADAIDRIVDEFSGDLQESVRSRLAESVVGILHQNLEVVKSKKTGKEIQVPSASGFLMTTANHKSKLRQDYSRAGIAGIVNAESWAVSYQKAYDELVKRGVIEDTPENQSKLIP